MNYLFFVHLIMIRLTDYFKIDKSNEIKYFRLYFHFIKIKPIYVQVSVQVFELF